MQWLGKHVKSAVSLIDSLAAPASEIEPALRQRRSPGLIRKGHLPTGAWHCRVDPFTSGIILAMAPGKCILALVVFTADPAFLTADEAQLEPRVIHVCDLARSLGSYDSKLVGVRGTLFSGRHGATVSAKNCRQGTPFREFRSGIAINLDVDLTPGHEIVGPGGKRYPVDRVAFERFERMAPSGSDDTPVTATFIGVLHVERRFELHPTPNQGYEGNGYGHMGRYPAELSIITVRDVVVGIDSAK